MPLLALDHVNLRTARLEAMTEFYRVVIGLELGPRPAFSFGGAWLYCGDRPVVHLVEVAEHAPAASNLALQHFAFRATDLARLLERLSERGIAHRPSIVQDFRLYQVNVTDPDGNRLHIDFDLTEAERLGLVSGERGPTWDAQIGQQLAPVEQGGGAPPEGLQPRSVILSSQNGSSMSFLRRPKRGE